MNETVNQVRVIETPTIRTVDPMIGFDNLAVFKQVERDRCFITPFEEKDVRYFKYRMEDLSRRHTSPERFSDELSLELKKWKDFHPDKRPLEPYLYAIKLYARILIDESGALNLEYLDSVARVILPYWQDDKDLEVLRHALVEWTWFQCRAVVIRMYSLKKDLSDGVLDLVVRKRLYCGNETEVAFDFLVAHSDVFENLQTLLEFVCQRVHQDRFYRENEIEVTFSLFNKFRKLFLSLNDDEKIRLQTYYEDHLSNIIDSYSRRRLERMFYGPPKSELESIFESYYQTEEGQRDEAFSIIQKNWDLHEWSQQELCARIQDDSLLDLFNHLTGYINPTQLCRALEYLTRSNFSGVEPYIQRELNRYSPKDNRWMPFALAQNELLGEPDLETIMREFFLHQSGYECASIIRMRLGDVLHHSGEQEKHSRLVLDMAESLIIPPNTKDERFMVENFFRGASILYTFPFCSDKYPNELDIFTKKAFSYATKNGDNLLLDSILDLLNELTNKRDAYTRYYRMLQDYCDTLPANHYRMEAVRRIVKRMIRW